MNAALSEAAEREKRAVQDAVARTTQEARETRAALENELAKERDARRADKSQFESRVAYGKEILGQKDAKLTQLAARLNKAEREATFLRQSRASPASAGGSGRDAKLEASHRNLEREYDRLRRKLNAALDRASKQLDADVSDDGDQLRLYAGRVRQLEAQLQEKTMAAAVAASAAASAAVADQAAQHAADEAAGRGRDDPLAVVDDGDQDPAVLHVGKAHVGGRHGSGVRGLGDAGRDQAQPRRPDAGHRQPDHQDGGDQGR